MGANATTSAVTSSGAIVDVLPADGAKFTGGGSFANPVARAAVMEPRTVRHGSSATRGLVVAKLGTVGALVGSVAFLGLGCRSLYRWSEDRGRGGRPHPVMLGVMAGYVTGGAFLMTRSLLVRDHDFGKRKHQFIAASTLVVAAGFSAYVSDRVWKFWNRNRPAADDSQSATETGPDATAAAKDESDGWGIAALFRAWNVRMPRTLAAWLGVTEDGAADTKTPEATRCPAPTMRMATAMPTASPEIKDNSPASRPPLAKTSARYENAASAVSYPELQHRGQRVPDQQHPDLSGMLSQQQQRGVPETFPDCVMVRGVYPPPMDDDTADSPENAPPRAQIGATEQT